MARLKCEELGLPVQLKALGLLYLVATVFSKLDASNDLLVDQVCSHGVLSRVVPGGKDLLAEEESPWCVSFLCTHLFGILLTLRYGIHHMVTSAAQRRDLDGEREREEGYEGSGLYMSRSSTGHVATYLVKEGNVEGEPKRIFESNFL